MAYRDTMKEIQGYRQHMAALNEKMRALQEAIEPEEVGDYIFRTSDGDKSLSGLFGDKDTLFVVHNMGRSCPSCTQWADGFNGLYDHLADRAAFVISSPDEPSVQAEFAASRGWRFPIVSHAGTDFAADMGYKWESGWGPGVSVFQRDGDHVIRVSDAAFGPGDAFNPVWHFFDLIPEGANGWDAKFSY